MTPSVFKESRKRMKLTQLALADRLGITLRMVQYMEKGDSPVSRTTEYALRWIAIDEFCMNLPVEYQKEIDL